MKKNCEGCRALSLSSYYSCDLGYKLDLIKGVPLEKCPKPKTYSKLFEAPKK